jgi:hypothetical protein
MRDYESRRLRFTWFGYLGMTGKVKRMHCVVFCGHDECGNGWMRLLF